jgi:dienelactone hydrolase
MKLKEEAVDYRDGDAELSGLLVWDGNELAHPGVVVVHGGAGLDDHAKSRARQFAELGLLVFACDMYGKAVSGDRERVLTCLRDLVADRAKISRRLQAGVDVLLSHPLGNGQVAAIGYCFGGRAVLELARTGAQLAGAISVHGSLESARPARAGDINTKVLVCHGAVDPHVPTTQLTGFVQEMNAAGTDYQLIVYGGAMHGFTHDIGPQAPGVAYHAASDQRSSLAIKAFFAEIFGMELMTARAEGLNV